MPRRHLHCVESGQLQLSGIALDSQINNAVILMSSYTEEMSRNHARYTAAFIDLTLDTRIGRRT